jgi:hypothetical protein
MWGIILPFVALVAVVPAVVSYVRVKAAMRRAGYSTTPRRQPLADLPKPVRKQLLRTIRRGEPVPPELQAHAEHWARFILVLARYGWSYVWLGVALIPLLLNALNPDPVVTAQFWVLVGCLVALVLVAFMLWRYYVAARRLLSGTAA